MKPVVVAVEKWKRSVLSKRSVFSIAIKRPPTATAANVDSICRWTAHTRRCGLVCWPWRRPLCCLEPADSPSAPIVPSSSVVVDTKQHRTGTVDQHATQIEIAAFTQLLFCLSGVLPRHDANPRREIAPWRNAAPLPIAASMAVETSGPKPGI